MAHDETAQPARSDDARERLRRVACAELNARRVNEALERGRPPRRVETVICECGAIGCTQKLTLELDAYLSARQQFERFLVAAGHDVESIDTVVERCDGYWVVEKRRSAIELAQRMSASDDHS
jgi:hypothetical protein